MEETTAFSFFKGRQTDATPKTSPPPYQVEVEDYIIVGVRFDEVAIRRHLPPELEALDDNIGLVAMYNAPRGWAIAPYSSFYVCIGVKGYDAPDGSPAFFLVRHFDDERAQVALNQHNGPFHSLGRTSVIREADLVIGLACVGDTQIAELSVRMLAKEDEPPTSGIHHYITGSSEKAFGLLSAAFTAIYNDAESVYLNFKNPEVSGLEGLDPLEVLWAAHVPTMNLVIGQARPLTKVGDIGVETPRVALLELVSRLGLSALLASRDGRILFATNDAYELLVGAREGGRLSVWRREDQNALASALRDTAHDRLISDPVAIRRPGSPLPVIARALPVSSVLAGEDALLITFQDPARAAPAPAQSILQVLGLTAAEARLATLVGGGLTVRKASGELGITENTARSTLKIVYDKLDIGKQSELAGVIARLS